MTVFEWRKSFQCVYDTRVIPNPFSMKESPKKFSYPEEPTPMAKFAGLKKLIAESVI